MSNKKTQDNRHAELLSDLYSENRRLNLTLSELYFRKVLQKRTIISI
ncbi:hypothetical protein LEP1GSC047_2300 [Leptospira inadai serovar Lyme str. 10]|uniref:Uncharacterized protein n=1 Tax=Leptospira inadai serovar Lyme str. 10 TaxID=1049790 RepID=V6HFQ5_9LEPT|nr:hypothetical protein LEP1GSC047_2300 [Leptospira inadai serovar Lyme str. 10]